MPPRKVTDVPAQTVAELNRGVRETRDLVEGFTIDFSQLMRQGLPEMSVPSFDRMRAGLDESYTKRFRLAASICFDELGQAAVGRLGAHKSDTIRGWSAYAVGLIPDISIEDRLAMVRPLADDPHFGVREWAWLGVRGAIVDEPEKVIALLGPWVHDASANIRRFATEATRPRGVWAAHIGVLKETPKLALPLLDPLYSDASKYVQDSVANWLNDASKTQPGWVRSVCERWMSESDSTATARICKRAMRTM